MYRCMFYMLFYRNKQNIHHSRNSLEVKRIVDTSKCVSCVYGFDNNM